MGAMVYDTSLNLARTSISVGSPQQMLMGKRKEREKRAGKERRRKKQ